MGVKAERHPGTVQDVHYKQELKRNLKLFSSFAVAFSFISITTGIFTNYQFVLTTGGPAGIWAWAVTFIGQLLVSTVFAEVASAIPVSGYSYQWIKRLSNNGLGWLTGWICFCFLVLVVPAIDSGMAPIVAQLMGLEGTPSQISAIIIGVLAIQAVINIVGVKLASWINNAAVFTESLGIIALTAVLLIMGLKNGANPAQLFDTAGTASGGSYLGAFVLCMLMGSFTLVGFESAANLSEETVNPGKTVPRAIIGAVGISGIFGMLFLIATTFSIKDYAATVGATSPISHIITDNLGPVIGTVFLVIVCVSIFACGTVSMTSGSRLIYAMSRDNAFFCSKEFKKISPKTQTPIAAIILILVFSIIATLLSSSLTTLIGVTAVLPALIYLVTIVCYGINRKKITFQPGQFNLGRAAKPVFLCAVVWLIVELCILTLPAQFHAIAFVTLALIAVGIVLYFGVFRSRIADSADFGREHTAQERYDLRLDTAEDSEEPAV